MMNRSLYFIFYLSQLLVFACVSQAYAQLSSEALRSIPRPGEDFDINNGKLLAPILRPRVPGSAGSTAVLNHFDDFFKTELPHWHISLQNSSSKVSAMGGKEYPFVNMIVTRDPPQAKTGDVGYLTLVAHYDSKISPEGFIGATDSAAPCAMLLHLARTLDDALSRKWAAIDEKGLEQEDYDLGLAEHTGLQIILLDGEEAFGTWTHTDSIYGAKSLAAEMEASYHPALSTYHNALSNINLFMLLDLLGEGSPAPRVPSYFKTTHWAYKNLASLETRLRDQSLFVSSPNHPSKRDSANQKASKGNKEKAKRQEPTWFFDLDKSNDRWMGGLVEDDHLPFMARGVDVLHIIPSPFPTVWHKGTDDGEHLDMDTVGDWAVLVTAFAAEWMELDKYMPTKAKHKREIESDRQKEITRKSEL